MATYYVWSGATGAANGTSWTDAYTTLAAVMAGQVMATGDFIYVADDHAETPGVAQSFTFSEAATGPVYVLAVNRTSGLLSSGALVHVNANAAITLLGFAYVHGIEFRTGAAGTAGAADINIASSAGADLTFSRCVFAITESGSGSLIWIGLAAQLNDGVRVRFLNCTFSPGGSAQTVVLRSATIAMRNCGQGGTTPTTMFSVGNATAMQASGCDFSAPTNLIDIGADTSDEILFVNCKVPATITTGTHGGIGGPAVELHACGNADHNYDYYREESSGIVEDSTAVYLTTGGAQETDNDGTATSWSLKMTGNARTSKYHPLCTPWIYKKVAATGSKTFSMKVAHTEAAVLTDIEAWLEVEYMGGAAALNTPQSQLETSFPVVSSTIDRDVLATGSNLSDTAEGWTGIASEKTHTLSKTVTVDEQGYVRARVALGKNIVMYANPDLAVA